MLEEIAASPATWVSISAWGLVVFVLNEGTTLPLWGCILAALGVVIVVLLIVSWIFYELTA